MKVGKLLKLSSSVKSEVNVPIKNEEGIEVYYSWNIDYSRREPNYFGSLHASIDCDYFLPKEVKQLEVESLTACNNKLIIFTKGVK